MNKQKKFIRVETCEVGRVDGMVVLWPSNNSYEKYVTPYYCFFDFGDRVFVMDACCNYETEKGKVARSYMSLGIKEGKYIPDTVKIKTELDSCIRVLMSESFDSIFINYSENFLKDRIIGYKSKEEFYQKWVDKGVEEVMSVIRREINYRKIMNPTEDDKIEFLK